MWQQTKSCLRCDYPFFKLDAANTLSNICKSKRAMATQTYLVKYTICLKSGEFTIFDSLKAKVTEGPGANTSASVAHGYEHIP